ncbi:hypothetical protein GFL91_13880 [Rhizobium leguminosarum bv. viciae]|uniref:Uncharacterized protein n=1 Tax=Rhizobium leguminosarum bv. viciae TaxID=387 RepID=A0A8I2GQI4_RHILV|nr:hypothetical protein [Rhizobium leguminosarum]MBY5529701.1 hypothetical protein [Rhizobium leguminosarum]NKM46061.1 hypothetical protein [Rhizobium leguminosarum bv. viciae]UFW79897.1 hypothetical protein RlegSU303_08240 [Rhizobium leguminosarum bv. viciae]
MPEKDLFRENTKSSENNMSLQGRVEANILANIRCEVTKGLFRAVANHQVPWLAGWGVTISLNLTWEEQSNISPGLSYSDSIGASSLFNVGGGISGSAHATRTEAITLTWDNAVLLKEAIATHKTDPALDCSVTEKGVTVESNLKIDEFIFDKASIAATPTSTTRGFQYAPFSTFQETLTFVVAFSGGITPTWKLKKFTVNPDGSFFGATRTKTSNIIVTLGPIAAPATAAGMAELGLQAQVQHQAALLGGSTASAILSQSP